MRPDRTLTRAARLTGAAVCLLLALSGLGWILRDLSVAREPAHVWWLWAGMPGRPGRGLVWATSLNDLFLCCVQFAAALAVLRSRAAAGALAAVGAVTVALRVPSLWIIREEWLPAAGGDLRAAAMLTSVAGVALGLVLLAVAAAGRRPTGRDPFGDPFGDRAAHGAGHGVVAVRGAGVRSGAVQRAGADGSGHRSPAYGSPAYGSPAYGAPPARRPTARPGRWPVAVVFPFLAAAATAGAAWQIHWFTAWHREVYAARLTGGPRDFSALLQVPAAWTAWTAVLLSLAAALAVLARAPFARPPAMTAAALLLATGAAALSVQLRVDLYDRVGVLPTEQLLDALTGLFLLSAGAVALCVLLFAPRGAPGTGRRAGRPDTAPSPMPPPPVPRPPRW